MFKTFSAIAIAATVGFTSLGITATPAQANDDLARFIFGAIALGIIAQGINEAHSGNNTPVVTPPRPNPPRALTIPARCERHVTINNRAREIYLERCLRRNGIPLRRISSCARQGEFRGQIATYYRKRCLRRAGHHV
jgi:hypothetical protein